MNFYLDYFLTHFMEILSILAIFILIVKEKSFEPRTRGFIFALVITIFLLSFYDYIDFAISELENYSPSLVSLRFIASCICYAIKPILLLLTIILIFEPSRKTNLFISVPAVFNAVISLSSYYTGFVCTIDRYNSWHAGPLRIVTFGINGVYYLILLLFFFHSWKRNTVNQRIAIGFLLFSILTSVIIDTISLSSHTIVLATTISFMMYYLFIYTQKSNEIIEYQHQKLEEQTNNLLSSQIQPHFIYNTLNIIYSLCHTNPSLAGDTILNFSSYLRTNLELSTDTELIDIEKEIEQTKLYSGIEQLRFTELQVEYDIHDENYNVPFLIIQPMVENAIRHGVRGIKGGKVTVSLYQEIHPLQDSYHVIVIKDNGTGKSLANTTIGKHKSVGITNVKYRVENMVKGKFNIDMSPNGTTVTIKIPL